MRISDYIAGQFARPKGIIGRIMAFIMNYSARIQYQSVFHNLKGYQEGRTLEIGFGNGKMLNKLAKKSQEELYGIDISPDMLKLAAAENQTYMNEERIKLTLADVMNLPYSNDMFQKIFTVNTIYFWDDIDRGLLEVNRVLQKDGVFINALYSKKFLEATRYTERGFHKYTLEDLNTAAQRNGFKTVKTIKLKHNTAYCIVLQKNLKI